MLQLVGQPLATDRERGYSLLAMAGKTLFTLGSHPAEDFWDDLDLLLSLSDVQLESLARFVEERHLYDLPEQEVERLASDWPVDLHGAATIISLIAFLTDTAFQRGLSGAEATESLGQLTPRDEQRGTLLERRKLLARLFEPRPELVARGRLERERAVTALAPQDEVDVRRASSVWAKACKGTR